MDSMKILLKLLKNAEEKNEQLLIGSGEQMQVLKNSHVNAIATLTEEEKDNVINTNRERVISNNGKRNKELDDLIDDRKGVVAKHSKQALDEQIEKVTRLQNNRISAVGFSNKDVKRYASARNEILVIKLLKRYLNYRENKLKNYVAENSKCSPLARGLVISENSITIETLEQDNENLLQEAKTSANE